MLERWLLYMSMSRSTERVHLLAEDLRSGVCLPPSGELHEEGLRLWLHQSQVQDAAQSAGAASAPLRASRARNSERLRRPQVTLFSLEGNLGILRRFRKKLYRGDVYNELINNYNIGILTAIIRKKNYEELKKKFDERFSIIGDFDLFLRLSKLCKFESVQTPLAYYRLHGKNLSTIHKEKEIEELTIWLRENEDTLNKFNVKRIKKNIYRRKFVNCKIDGNYKECLNILLNSGLNLLNLKNLIIFLLPVSILKKLLWYHQD